MSDTKKVELKRLIDAEHGVNYHKNINMSGFTVYKRDSFLTFHFTSVEGVQTVVIDYIYCTNKKDLIKLLSFCINFWSGNCVKFIYYKEHKRKQNFVDKYFSMIGFTVLPGTQKSWKHPWISDNGYLEDQVLEAYI